MVVLFFAGGDRVMQNPVVGVVMMLGAVVCLIAQHRIASHRIQRGSTALLLPTDLLALPAFRIALIASVGCLPGKCSAASPCHAVCNMGLS